MTKDPTRLIESDKGALGEEIAAVRRRLPSSERMAKLAARLAEAGADVGEPPRAREPLGVVDGPPAPPKGVESGTKLIVLALLAGGALIAGATFLREPDAPLRVVLPPTLVASSPVTAPPVTPPGAGTVEHNGASAPAVPTPQPPTELGAAPSAAPAGATLAAPDATTPMAAATETARASSEPSARAERETARGTPKTPVARGANATEGAPLAENTVVVSEVELLKAARSALAADPVQAFTLTERCRAQYPNGGFAQERDFIAISALLRMGRADEARSRVSLFKMHYPSSAYAPRLARMLGDE